MWIPKDTAEFERIIASGLLQESSTFEVKQQVPEKDGGLAIAKSIAAMGNYGGTFIVGAAEDDDGRVTTPCPIELIGAVERITNIIWDSITEPPVIDIREYPLAKNPARGYIVIGVPASQRAPHMVKAKNNYRYYGRVGKQNMPMEEGQVAGLYARRLKWEQDANEMIDAAIRQALQPTVYGYGDLHFVVKPIFAGAMELDNLIGPKGFGEVLNVCMKNAREHFGHKNFIENDLPISAEWERRSGGWVAYLSRTPIVREIRVDRDGGGYAFYRAVASFQAVDGEEKRILVLDEILTTLLTGRLVALYGQVLSHMNYDGLVRIGVAVTGIGSAIPRSQLPSYPDRYFSYENDEYRQLIQCSAREMANDPRAIARRLMDMFMRETTYDYMDPFEKYTTDPE